MVFGIICRADRGNGQLNGALLVVRTLPFRVEESRLTEEPIRLNWIAARPECQVVAERQICFALARVESLSLAVIEETDEGVSVSRCPSFLEQFCVVKGTR
jgi:hypothetical protein